MVTVQLRYDCGQAQNEVVLHEEFVELSFFGVDQEASHGFEKEVEHLGEVDVVLGQESIQVVFIFECQVEDFEEQLDVGGADHKGTTWRLDSQKAETAFQQSLKEALILHFIRLKCQLRRQVPQSRAHLHDLILINLHFPIRIRWVIVPYQISTDV